MANLDKIITLAKNDSKLLEDVIKSYTPFILASASRLVKKSVSIHDDEASISMMAFAEAVKSYKPDKGHFIIFVKKVIRFRLIVYMRKNSRYNSEIASDSNDSEAYTPTEVNIVEDPVRIEIEVFVKIVIGILRIIAAGQFRKTHNSTIEISIQTGQK